MSNVSRLDDHNDDGSPGISLSRQMRMMPVQYLPGPTTATAIEPDDITVLMQYLQVVWKHKWIVVAGAVLGILTGLGISLSMTPLYRASTTLEIQDFQEPMRVNSLAAADPNMGTQIQLLSSQTMRQRVGEVMDANPATFPRINDPLASLRRLVGLADPAKSVKWSDAVWVAAMNLRITQGKDSRILLIESQSTHPRAAADFTNTLAQEYISRNKEERWEAYKSTGEWLSRAQDELKHKLEQSERRLQDFARNNGLIITGSQNAAEEKLKQLQMELAKATADRISREATYESSLSSPTEALPEILDNGPMAQYQVQLSDLRRQLAELSTTLTSDHYKVQRLQAQIKELESNRDRERKNILSRIRIDYDSAKKREAQLEQDFKKQAQILAGQAEQIIDFNMLQREVDTNKKLYEQTLAQSKEAGLASAMRSSNARIVDPAPVPANPQSPNIPLNLALSVIGGLICGTLFVVVRSALDARVQVPGSLGSQLNLRELGVIPSAAMFPELRTWPRLLSGVVSKRKGKTKEKGKEKTKEKSTSILSAEEEPKVKVIHDSLELITWTQKTSVMSEAFRSVMTSILFSSENGNQPQILVVTSPAPQEGKTTVTTNLAIALAEINHRVLLIDADMRLPRLHSIFDLPNSVGLSDALRDRRPVDEYLDEELIQKTHIPNLHLMLAGPARSNFSRLLYSSRMKDLLARFRGTFDTILLDSAPVLTVPDARILARAADAVVLVIRAHQTHQESAFAAVRCFEEDGRRVLGTILNDWNPKRSPYGPYRGYGGYGSYGTYSYYEPNSSGYKVYGPVGETEDRRQR